MVNEFTIGHTTRPNVIKLTMDADAKGHYVDFTSPYIYSKIKSIYLIALTGSNLVGIDETISLEHDANKVWSVVIDSLMIRLSIDVERKLVTWSNIGNYGGFQQLQMLIEFEDL